MMKLLTRLSELIPLSPTKRQEKQEQLRREAEARHLRRREQVRAELEATLRDAEALKQASLEEHHQRMEKVSGLVQPMKKEPYRKPATKR